MQSSIKKQILRVYLSRVYNKNSNGQALQSSRHSTTSEFPSARSFHFPFSLLFLHNSYTTKESDFPLHHRFVAFKNASSPYSHSYTVSYQVVVGRIRKRKISLLFTSRSEDSYKSKKISQFVICSQSVVVAFAQVEKLCILNARVHLLVEKWELERRRLVVLIRFFIFFYWLPVLDIIIHLIYLNLNCLLVLVLVTYLKLNWSSSMFFKRFVFTDF